MTTFRTFVLLAIWVFMTAASPAADGSHSLYAAVIVKRVDEKTRAKTAINELLRA